jgi:hypothetical protein
LFHIQLLVPVASSSLPSKMTARRTSLQITAKTRQDGTASSALMFNVHFRFPPFPALTGRLAASRGMAGGFALRSDAWSSGQNDSLTKGQNIRLTVRMRGQMESDNMNMKQASFSVTGRAGDW